MIFAYSPASQTMENVMTPEEYTSKTPAAPSETQYPSDLGYFVSIPAEIVSPIFLELPIAYYRQLEVVCKDWQKKSNDPKLLLNLGISRIRLDYEGPMTPEIVRAHSLKIKLNILGNADEILNHISNFEKVHCFQFRTLWSASLSYQLNDRFIDSAFSRNDTLPDPFWMSYFLVTRLAFGLDTSTTLTEEKRDFLSGKDNFTYIMDSRLLKQGCLPTAESMKSEYESRRQEFANEDQLDQYVNEVFQINNMDIDDDLEMGDHQVGVDPGASFGRDIPLWNQDKLTTYLASNEPLLSTIWIDRAIRYFYDIVADEPGMPTPESTKDLHILRSFINILEVSPLSSVRRYTQILKAFGMLHGTFSFPVLPKEAKNYILEHDIGF
jgi:hypothetical protein